MLQDPVLALYTALNVQCHHSATQNYKLSICIIQNILLINF